MSADSLCCGVCCVLIKLAAVFGGFYLLRKFVKGRQFTERVDATGKVAVVTGASSGIGKQVAAALNKAGAKVYLLCRSRERANQAIDDIVQQEGCDRGRLLLRLVDLTSFESIRTFAEAFRKEERTVDILINNAGVFFLPEYTKTVDGFETTFQTNYLSHFLLTDLLLEQLRASGNARIVNVSSSTYEYGDSVRENVVNDPAKYSQFKPYFRSKLANVMHARWLTALWEESGEHRVTINACHPGAVKTNILHYSFFSREPINTLLKPIFWIFFKTDKEGTQTILYLALSREVKGISGKYFSDCREAKLSAAAKDDDACRELHEFSVGAVYGKRKFR